MKEKISEGSLALELKAQDIQGLCQRYLSSDFGRPRKQTKEFCEETFKVLRCELKPISEGPAGFLGRHNFLNVEIKMPGEKSEKQEISFFTKSAPVGIASRMEYLEEFGVFKKEIIVYRDVLTEIEKIFPNIAPKCYFTNKNLLVFENLSQQGFKMGARRDGLLDYEHLNCAMKTLAALHAGSFCLEERTGRTIRELFPEAVIENSYPSNVPEEHLRLQNFNQANEVFKAIVATLPKYRENLDFILSEMPQKMSRIFELSRKSEKYPNVFNHGDIWSNNIMFNYSKFGEIPIECRLVDFQLARYVPPMADLITMLTIPTSRKFREQYLDELINDYYRFMKDFLRRENLNIEEFLPAEQFFESVEEYRILGLIESCLFSHLTILPPEAANDLTTSTDGFSDFFNRKRVDICMKAFHTDQVYRDRLTDMLEDFVDNYVLSQ